MDDLAIIDRFTETFSRYIDSGFGLLAGDVAFLTSVLVAIDITLAGLFWALMGEDNVPAQLIRKVLYVGFFALLLEQLQGPGRHHLPVVRGARIEGVRHVADGGRSDAAGVRGVDRVHGVAAAAGEGRRADRHHVVLHQLRDDRGADAGLADRAAGLLRAQRPALHHHHRVQADRAGRLRAGAVRAVRTDGVPGRARARQCDLGRASS